MYLFLLILIVVSYCRDFFSLVFEQSHCISNLFFSKVWIYYCPELCVNLFLGIWAEALDILFFGFFSLSSHTSAQRCDKELEFCVTTIREFCLCFLSLYLLEITESHHYTVTQFLCLMEEWVSFGLGLHLSGDWLRGAVLICVFAPHMLLLQVQHTLISTLLLRPCLLLLGQLKQGILRMILPWLSYHLPSQRPKEKLQQSKLTL